MLLPGGGCRLSVIKHRQEKNSRGCGGDRKQHEDVPFQENPSLPHAVFAAARDRADQRDASITQGNEIP
jgi:hypothetical protein